MPATSRTTPRSPAADVVYFEPYHAALAAEIARLREAHPRVVLYDCHSIRSIMPRLFDGELPHMNIGTNSGASCDPQLQQAIEADCAASPFTLGRQRPLQGRLDHPPLRPARPTASTPCRWSSPAAATCDEPARPDEDNWPSRLRCRKARCRCGPSWRKFSQAASNLRVRQSGGPHDPHRQRPRHPRAARHRDLGEELADRGAAAHADEQSRPRRRGAAGRARRLWRHRPRRARLGELRPHRRRAAPAGERPDAARPVRQAGRRLPHPCRCAARADRQFQPRAALGDLGAFPRARSQGPDDVRPDDRRLVDLYRQPGHRAGHLRDLRRDRPPALSAATFPAGGS